MKNTQLRKKIDEKVFKKGISTKTKQAKLKQNQNQNQNQNYLCENEHPTSPSRIFKKFEC